MALKGTVNVPGDKSISHRAVMFGSLAKGKTRISNFLMGADCLSTIDCFRKLGIPIDISPSGDVTVSGKGLRGLSPFDGTLDVGNSGTTMRLISGILSGQPFGSRLTGDASIQKRPMKRIITPLGLMGAGIESEQGKGCAPLVIKPASLKGITYDSPVASAQVKSAVLLAGLYATGKTTVYEPVLSRDHTERMLKFLGADIESITCVTSGTSGNGGAGADIKSITFDSNGTSGNIRPGAVINPGSELFASDIVVPGDISSAAYFIAAASTIPGSEVILKNVGLNPTRDGILKVLEAMGGSYKIIKEYNEGCEPAGDILVRYSPLHGTVIEGDIIPTLIDEIPVIAVMAAIADGQTIIKDAGELRVKESDRIAVMCDNLNRIGAMVTPTEDGMIINGNILGFTGGIVDPHMDHRIAMSFAVASLHSVNPITVKDRDCVNISYPDFYKDLNRISE